LLELAKDLGPLVRGDVIHALTDSTPALRLPAHRRRTGKVTDAAR